jgi:sugar fermentation stimulation protein A
MIHLREPLLSGKLIRRYKRFLADVALDSGQIITAHCPNSGSMMGLSEPHNSVLLSKSDNPRRKLALTLELIEVSQTWVCVNTMVPNRLVFAAMQNNAISELKDYTEIKKEAIWVDSCRFDFRLKNEHGFCFVEVKNVTLEENGWAIFPDAITLRGKKHLHHLMEVVRAGHRAVMLFLVNRSDCDKFRPAAHIDPDYAEALRTAAAGGVEILVYRTVISPPGVSLDCRLPFEL